MKKRISLLLVAAMLLSMLPLSIWAQEDSITVASVVDAEVTADGYVVTYNAETTGTLNVTMGTCSPGWQYVITGPNYDSGNRGKYSAGTSCDYAVTETGLWTVTVYAYTSADGHVAGTVSFDVIFTANAGDVEVQKAEYEVSQTKLALGDNSLTLLETAETTIYTFKPEETAVYTFTAPEGAILGYWGAGSWYLADPGSTTNTYEWTCTGVGQTAYIGVSGVDGTFNLKVEKTGDYTVVETPIVKYENKATLAAWTKPEGAAWGSYVDVFGETHTAVLGDDGYYHLDSADGDVLVVNLKYQEIILSDALKSDRPVMYAYMYDENGVAQFKYDIGDAVLAYEEVMDENGYYPVTEDILLFYQVYAVQAGTFTFHVTGDYNEDCVWMYCMRTMNMDDVTVDPSEPTDPTDPSEPETEPTEPSEPTPSEPVSGEVVLNENVTAGSAMKYTYSYKPTEDGTLSVTVGDGSTNWNADIVYFQGVTMHTVASANGSDAASFSAQATAGTTYRIRVWNNSGALAETPVLVVFTPAGGTTPEPSEPETDPTEPSEPETEPTEPSAPTEPSEPETEPTEPSTPSVPDEDVPAGTVFAVYAVDGTATYYSSASQIISVFKGMTSGTLKLYQDVSLGSNKCLEVYAGNCATLDLNGCTVSNNYGSIGCLYVDGADVTVIDTSADQSGLLYNSHASGIGIYVWSGTCTLAGGNVETLGNGVRVQNTGNFVMTGGNVLGGNYGINVMTGCSASISGGYSAHSKTGSTYYALMGASNTTIAVSGGYFNGGVGGSGLNGKISGGFFSKKFNTSYLATDCEFQDNDDATYLFKVVNPNTTEPEPSEPETEPTEPVKDAYAVSTTTLSVGSNTVSMISTAEATIFKFAPTEAGTYIITGPEGSKVGIWGYSTNLNDPNSTSNSCELTLANVGPTARVGVTGAEGQIVLTITKHEEPTEPSEPETEPSEPTPSEPVSGEVVLNENVTADSAMKYTYSYKPTEDGTLSVTVGDGSTNWNADIVYFQGVTMYTVASANGSDATTFSVEVTAGTTYRIRVWNNSGALAATPVLAVFTPAGGTTPEPSEPETEPTEPSEPETEPTTPSEPEPSEPVEGGTLISVENEAVTTDGYTYTFQAETTGTLNVTMGDCTPGWRYQVLGPNFDSGLKGKFSAGTSKDYTVNEVGEWKVVFYAYSSAETENVDGTVSFTVTFTPDASEPEVEKEEYQVSDTALALGDNTLTLLDTAETTIYVFEPTETAVYTFTAPEGAILGYWGAGSWFLSNPNSTTNTYEWTCTGVGQTAYIGVSGVDGEFTLNVAKTGDYEVVVTPIVPYENKATLETFTLPEGATLGEYVDVFGQTHTAVLGEDGYYHLDSVDGPILLIDMDYMDIILSAALQSDRPVMYAYMYDEDGNVTLKYDIGNAVKAYEAVMDENGYYPVTEDILLFYQVYAVQAGTFTFHVSGEYNEDCVWMYCMRTMTLPDPEPTVELTHVSLNPGKDALGYKAAATNLPEGAHVEISLWITEDVVVTRATDTLRLVNILACNGGQTTINAKATIVDSEGNVIAESAVHQTTMMETLQTVNANWSTYNQTQQDAVRALCEQYADTVADWGLDNILVPETSAE